MKAPILVRPFTDGEESSIRAGLRSSDAFTLRRCQILLLSRSGQRAKSIARQLGCGDQTVRNAIHAFNERGAASLTERSHAPKTVRAVIGAGMEEAVKAILHRSPRAFGKPRSLWTLGLLSEVFAEQGLTPTRLSGEAVRKSLKRLKIDWQRAKHWITSPDPAYARKRGRGTD